MSQATEFGSATVFRRFWPPGVLIVMIAISIWAARYESDRESCLPLGSLFVVSGTTAWVAGCAGVYVTRNGGSTWKKLSLDRARFNVPLSRLGILLRADAQRALIRERDGLSDVTVDDVTREGPRFPDSNFGKSGAMQFLDALNGWSCQPSGIGHTTNGGASWQLDESVACSEVVPISADEAWIDVIPGTLAHTIDGGKSWKQLSVGPVATCLEGNAMRRLKSGEIWLNCVDANHTYHSYHSLNRGRSWTSVSPPDYAGILAFSSETEGWGIGDQDDGEVLNHTSDGGKTWNVVLRGLRRGSYQLDTVADGQAWLLDTRGIMYVIGHEGKSTRRSEIVARSLSDRFRDLTSRR